MEKRNGFLSRRVALVGSQSVIARRLSIILRRTVGAVVIFVALLGQFSRRQSVSIFEFVCHIEKPPLFIPHEGTSLF